MTSSSPEQAVRRVAELQLRGSAGPLPARVGWPVTAGTGRPPALLVVCPGAQDGPPDPRGTEALGRELCARVGLVVLWPTRAATFADAATAVEWAADHAAQLDADPRRLLVAGQHGGGRLAAAVALHARDQRWPALLRQVLVLPDFGAGPSPSGPLAAASLAGVAPATVVIARRGRIGREARAYAQRLTESDVAVDELQHDLADDRMLADLARSLRRALAGAEAIS